MKTKTLLPYVIGLPSYLDAKGIDWKPYTIEEVGDFIVVLKELQAVEVFELAMAFTTWREKYV